MFFFPGSLSFTILALYKYFTAALTTNAIILYDLKFKLTNEEMLRNGLLKE